MNISVFYAMPISQAEICFFNFLLLPTAAVMIKSWNMHYKKSNAYFKLPEDLAWHSQSGPIEGPNRVSLSEQYYVRLDHWVVPEWKVIAGQ